MTQAQVEFNKQDADLIISAFKLYYEATYVVGNDYDASNCLRNRIFAVAVKLSKVIGEDITDSL